MLIFILVLTVYNKGFHCRPMIVLCLHEFVIQQYSVDTPYGRLWVVASAFPGQLDDISAAWANGVLDEDSHRDHTFDT